MSKIFYFIKLLSPIINPNMLSFLFKVIHDFGKDNRISQV